MNDTLGLSSKALGLVADHFDALNNKDAERARRHLFHPPTLDTRPLDIYVRDMIAMGPYQLIASSVSRVAPPRMKRHGVFGTVWVDVEVDVLALGRRKVSLPVWVSPDSNELLLGIRLSDWLFEWRRKEH